MKDLDFDELDKAVNSLMTGVPKDPTLPKDQESEKTLDITPTLGADDKPSFDKLDAVTAEVTSLATPTEAQKEEVVADMPAQLAVTPPPATKRVGRFMDVVHPSSDMKKPTLPLRPISRQGATIEPGVASRPDAIKSSTFLTPARPQPAVEAPQLTAPPSPVVDTVPDTTAKDTWPDPLEVADFKADVLPKEEEWSAPAAAKLGTPVQANEEEQAPLTSPFLPDTKVEKRPLGSDTPASVEEPDQIPAPEASEDKTVDDPNAQLPAIPSDVQPVLPEELQGDMMAVEADTHMGMPKTELSHPTDEKLLESGKLLEPTSPSAPTGPTSIPQQYHEEPSTGDQKNGGIYDTDSYHQPLAHPAKKKSGWLWIVWILVILLVGAAAGAALYFFIR